MKRTSLRLVAVLLLTAIFLFFFLRSVDWKEVLGYLGEVNLPIFFLSVLLVPLHLITRSWRWYFLLVQEKKNIPISRMVYANTVGFAVNFVFPGRLGEIVRPIYLAQKEKIRKGFALGTIVIERTFDLFTNCFLLGFFLLVRPLVASRFRVSSGADSKLYFWGITGLAIAVALLLLSLGLYFFRAKTLAFLAFFLKPFPRKFSERVLGLTMDFIAGLKFFQSLRTFFLYVLSSFVVWLGIIFFYWVFFFGFQIRISFFNLIPYVFLTMVGASIPTPGMVGGFHYFSKLGLTALYGIDVNLAVGATIMAHAVQAVVTALLGYVILWKDGVSFIQLRRLGEQENR